MFAVTYKFPIFNIFGCILWLLEWFIMIYDACIYFSIFLPLGVRVYVFSSYRKGGLVGSVRFSLMSTIYMLCLFSIPILSNLFKQHFYPPACTEISPLTLYCKYSGGGYVFLTMLSSSSVIVRGLGQGKGSCWIPC